MFIIGFTEFFSPPTVNVTGVNPYFRVNEMLGYLLKHAGGFTFLLRAGGDGDGLGE